MKRLFATVLLSVLSSCTVYWHEGRPHLVTVFEARPLSVLLGALAAHPEYYCYDTGQGVSVYAMPPVACPDQRFLERSIDRTLCVMRVEEERLQGTVLFYVPYPIDCNEWDLGARGCLAPYVRTALVRAGPDDEKTERVALGMLLSPTLTRLHVDRLEGRGDEVYEGGYFLDRVDPCGR